jgi:hypothetical protein
MTNLHADDLWRATSEPKCKFLSWLVLHDKVLTTNNMSKKNWPCDPMYSLCFCIQETIPHLIIECNYSKAVWNIIAAHFSLPTFQTLHASGGPLQWIILLRSIGSKNEKKKKLSILFSFWWRICKERNCRIFEHMETSVAFQANQVKGVKTLGFTLSGPTT